MQLATTIGMLDIQAFGKHPSKSMVNPRENANAITLKSLKKLEELPKVPTNRNSKKRSTQEEKSKNKEHE